MTTPTIAQIEAALARENDAPQFAEPGEVWRLTKYPDVWASSLGRVAHRDRHGRVVLATTFIPSAQSKRCTIIVDGAYRTISVSTLMRDAFFPNTTGRLIRIGDPNDMSIANLRLSYGSTKKPRVSIGDDKTYRANLARLLGRPLMTYEEFVAAYASSPLVYVVRETSAGSDAQHVRLNYLKYRSAYSM